MAFLSLLSSRLNLAQILVPACSGFILKTCRKIFAEGSIKKRLLKLSSRAMSDPVMEVTNPITSVTKAATLIINAIQEKDTSSSKSNSVETYCESSTSSTCVQQTVTKESTWQLNGIGDADGPLSHKWKKPSESMMLVQHFLGQGLTPKEVLNTLLPHYSIPPSMTDEFAIQLILELCSEKRTREKLPNLNTFGDAVELFRKSKNILILTGAGVSVSCGIPDFRSANGIYARLHADFPELPDPTAMFDIDFFRKNPVPFYNFAREIFPGQFQPSISHMFIRFLEEEGKLLRNYTQNIDTLEKVAGIERVVECHGSFAKVTCLDCKHEIDSDEIKEDVLAQRVPYCKKCETGVIKPNIVFFGEDLSDKFHIQMGEDNDKVDLLVVIGSSLKVQPVALIPYNVEADVPQILINREQLTRYQADIKLLGNCDDIIIALCMAIGGNIQQKMVKELSSRSKFSSYVASIAELQLSPPPSFLPKQLSTQQFKKMIEVEEDKEIDEPAFKRSKTDTKDMNDTETPLLSMWQSNYVSVETHLPPNATLMVPPNINVFKGAELYYERDNDIFVHSIGARQHKHHDDDEEFKHSKARRLSSYSSSPGFSSSDSFDSDDSAQRYGSCPPFLQEETSVETEGMIARTRTIRASSCQEDETVNPFYTVYKQKIHKYDE